MAAQRHLQPAAKGRAVDASNNGLGRLLHAVQHFQQVGAFGLPAKLGNVGAGYKGAPLAVHQHRLDVIIGLSGGDVVVKALTHPRGERVDRWVVYD